MVCLTVASPKGPEPLVGGRCCHGCTPIRNWKSKWYASLEQYPHATYPDICFGTSYILSMTAARQIYAASKDVPFFYLEDVYTTGLVANNRLGIKLVSIPGFFNYKPTFKECFYKNELISSHGFNGHTLRDTWSKLQRVVAARCPPPTVGKKGPSIDLKGPAGTG
jgi:hypothetical protein